MATYTEKLGLKMPAQTDFYNVDDFNENFRKIDQNTAQSGDIQQVLTLADPIRSNRAPTTADKQYAGKLWVVPKMIFNNMMPNALTQVAGNWHATAATVSVSGNTATLVGDGTASTIAGEVNMTAVKANDIVYIAAKMTVTADANGAVLELLCGDEVIATTSMSIPVAGNNIRLIGHTKVGAAGALKLRTTAMYNSASAQLGKGVTISDITILDLTADMCQNFAGIEFSKDAATTYIDTYGNFQTKTYELSEYWWICRGSYGGKYSWQRYDDYTNAVMNEYSTNYQNSKATTTEAQAGTNDTHWMTPLKTQQFLTNRLATQAEVNDGTNNAKVVTPLTASGLFTNKQATLPEVKAGTNDTKWVTPHRMFQALTAADSSLTIPWERVHQLKNIGTALNKGNAYGWNADTTINSPGLSQTSNTKLAFNSDGWQTTNLSYFNTLSKTISAPSYCSKMKITMTGVGTGSFSSYGSQKIHYDIQVVGDGGVTYTVYEDFEVSCNDTSKASEVDIEIPLNARSVSGNITIKLKPTEVHYSRGGNSGTYYWNSFTVTVTSIACNTPIYYE